MGPVQQWRRCLSARVLNWVGVGADVDSAAALARSRPTDRLGRACAGPSQPGNLGGIARRAARDRHPQPLTVAGRRVTRKPVGGRTGRDSAPKPETRRSKREGGLFGDRFVGPATQKQPTPCGFMSQAMMADVPLARISMLYLHGCRFAPQYDPRGGANSPALGCLLKNYFGILQRQCIYGLKEVLLGRRPRTLLRITLIKVTP